MPNVTAVFTNGTISKIVSGIVITSFVAVAGSALMMWKESVTKPEVTKMISTASPYTKDKDNLAKMIDLSMARDREVKGDVDDLSNKVNQIDKNQGVIMYRQREMKEDLKEVLNIVRSIP